MKYTLRLIDFETTGIPTDEVSHSVIESALIDVCADEKAIKSSSTTLVAPTTQMDIEAQAVHHISEMQATREGRIWDEVQSTLSSHNDDETIIYVAHKADYEKQFFNPPQSIWIDTYKVALVLYPDAPRHTNQVLKYYLEIEDAPHHHPPHRALPDCHVTVEVLKKMAEKMTFNEMIQISKQPPYLTKIAFGKHRGTKFEDLPYDYCQWVMKQDFDEGVKAGAQRRIEIGL
jgi:exodeoxyribonuclease X